MSLLSALSVVLLVAGIQSDDAGTLHCLKPGTHDSLAELELIVQGMRSC